MTASAAAAVIDAKRVMKNLRRKERSALIPRLGEAKQPSRCRPEFTSAAATKGVWLFSDSGIGRGVE